MNRLARMVQTQNELGKIEIALHQKKKKDDFVFEAMGMLRGAITLISLAHDKLILSESFDAKDLEE